MIKVRRRFTVKRQPVRAELTSRDFPDVDMDLRTLTQRCRALKPGDSLYPFARTHLVIQDGKRKWVANAPGPH